MPAVLVQSKTGFSALTTTTPAFDAAPTPGNVIVLSFASDAYNGTPDTGWTESAEMEQQTFHGGYKWWKIAPDATNSFPYTIGSAVSSAWVLEEWSGLDVAPYDMSEGQFQQTSTNDYATATITPTTGERLLHATMGTSIAGGGQGYAGQTPGSWSNGFALVAGSGGAAGQAVAVSSASLAVTGDGATGYATTATWPNPTFQPAQAKSAMVISFKVASSDPPVNTAPPSISGVAQVGQTLTCAPGTWVPDGTKTYQWQRRA